MSGDLTEIRITDLAARFIHEYREGSRPSINDYAVTHADLASEIRELFPGLIMLEGMAQNNHLGPYPTSLLSRVKRPDTLGDYRILQEIGAGGMGVVYEAEQISLARHVALKVLPFQKGSDQHAVERFQREARAAAGLVHENIVPVYEVGEDASVWFYAMQFIHGQSLHEVRLHLESLVSQKDGTDVPQMGQLSELARGLFGEKDQNADDSSSFPATDLTRISAEAPQSRVSDVRASKLRSVIDECLRHRAAGFQIADDELISQHPSLMPELSEELKLLRLLEASRPPELVDDLIRLRAELEPTTATNSQGCDSTIATPTASVSEFLASDSDGDSHLKTYFVNLALLVADVASALAYAHQQGIVHRDIKPANLLLDTRGRIWVTDFGLAHVANAEPTATGKLCGTLRYMSPQQVKGACDARSDVYSLGITLYEMATLRQAIQGEHFVDTIQQICHIGPRAPRQVEPRVPRDLERIIQKAIARDPEERYQSACEFESDLRRFVNGEPIEAHQTNLLERAARWVGQNWINASFVGMAIVAWCMMLYMSSVIQHKDDTIIRLQQQQIQSAAMQPSADE